MQSIGVAYGTTYKNASRFSYTKLRVMLSYLSIIDNRSSKIIEKGVKEVELRHLRYFIKAAELMNFTKAAEALYVSQPTLSVQIHQLEEELGTELFARVGRNVRLTESGKVFLARALQAVKELEEGSREIDAIKGLLRGSICVASLPLYGSRLMASWLAAFNAVHPNVLIHVRAAPSEDIEAGIISGTMDIGLSFLPVQHSELNSRELFKDEIVLVMSSHHEIAQKDSLQLSDLNNLSMALPSERISATRVLGKYFEEHKIQPNIRMSFDDGHAMIEVVKKGKFVTFLPRWTLKEDSEIRTFPLPSPGMRISTGAVWSHLSASTQALLDLITSEAKQLT